MRKLRKWERYVLFPKTKDNPLEGEIPLNIAQKEIKAHKAWPKPVAFIRQSFGAFTLLLRTRVVTASGKGNPFFGNPSTALRVGFDSWPKNSRSAVEQQSKTSRTTLEQHPKDSRTEVEEKFGYEPFFANTNAQLANTNAQNANAFAAFVFLRDSIRKHKRGICKPKYTVSNYVSHTCNHKSGISKHEYGIYEPKYGVSNCVSHTRNHKSGISKHECGICEPRYVVSNCVNHTCNHKSGISKHKCGICKPKYGVSNCISSIGKRINRICSWNSVISNCKSGIWVLKNVACKPECRKRKHKHCIREHVSGIRNCELRKSKRIPGESNHKKAQVSTKLVPSRDLVRYSFAICLVFLCLFSAYPLPFLCLLFGVSLLILCLYTNGSADNKAILTIGTSQLGEEQPRDNTLPDTYQARPAFDRHGFSTASRRLGALMAIGARSDNDQSTKPEMQNKCRRKVEQKQNTVRTASEKNAINLRSLYQKATVSIRVTYQKYTLDLLKTYQRLTKKLPTAYQEVDNKLRLAYAKFKNKLHGFSKYCVALWCDNQLGFNLITSRYNRSRTLFCQPWAICFVTIFFPYVLFSDAQAQSPEGREAVNGLTDIKPLQIGDTIPEALWNLPLQVVNHPDGKDTITLNEYRDKKLIILDFWATWCGPCIKSLHKLDLLQKHHVQDLFVLPVTDEPSVKAYGFINTQGWQLPSSVDNTELKKYFPYRSIPHQIWIRNNKFIAATGAEHHDDEQVLKIINGQAVTMKMKIDSLNFDPEKPLVIEGNAGRPEDLLYGSIITRAIDIRTGGNTYRPGHLLVHNASILQLYMEAFAQAIPFRNRVNRIAIELPKALQHSVSYEKNEITADLEVDRLAAWKEQNMYCYSLSINEKFSKPQMREIMQDHLNQYFGKELGIIGRVERRSIPVLALIANTDEALSKSDLSEIMHNATSLTIKNQPVDQLVNRLASANWKLDTPIIDLSEISSPIDVAINGSLNDLPNVKRQLRKVGLDLVNRVHELEILVITTI